MKESRKYGILVGGGPAPGINSVLSSVTIEATKRGHTVIGIYDGFQHLMHGEKRIEFLSIPKISRIHLHGGSILRTSRANPTKDERLLRNTVETLRDLQITHLITIGGDDTAFGASRVAEYASYTGHPLFHAHVPKTIDNDLPLPPGIPTFGFETARSEGARLVSTLYQDARTSGRWFVVVAMGRKTGHLALGIGKAAGATVTLIPEEFQGRSSLKLIVDIIAGSIIKRLASGRRHGVAIVAEGFLEAISQEELKALIRAEQFELDEYGHIRLAEINFSDIIKYVLKRRLEEFGVKITIVDQELGYELRCVDPNAYDIDYTRNLGFAAVDFLESGGTGAIISIQGDRIVPIPFKDLVDPQTGRIPVRYVDINSLSFRIAREYMIRLDRSDFEDPDNLRRLAAVCSITPERFRAEFEHVLDAGAPQEERQIAAHSEKSLSD
ncbi:MAG TPA: diphosphate--fructose-6-phosphate 1-phosphotransferase [Candidatus Nitrosotenuis sp.]|jgi:6-phosphofructokinase 1|nr:diphosphate--fructose-6-phosphate 1-phosphotransferase [Candidatus Nitrosotenuis sp.]